MVAPYTGLDLAQPAPRSSLARWEWKPTPTEVLSLLDRREGELGWRNRRLMATGLCILTGIPTVLLTLVGMWCVRYQSRPAPQTASFLGGVAAATIAFSMLLAPFIRRGSRADAIERFVNAQPHGGNVNPLIRILVSVMFAGALFGGFMCIDALKMSLLKLRLRGAGVDRIRCATVLKELLDHPAGVSPLLLMRYGEDVREFRRTLAWLMLHSWADISAQGDHVMLLSPARRALREVWTLD
jgi:hypothetical protein